ncbi:ATP-binding protein [Dyadobacter sp. CY345]|uniref:sensor histidine kinase n=1 Tax=Dyadobacter sp. CY345 TaxID=2909335 RepID=UPI001F368FE6|nr:ATP-binding protein [Dyadobacter sp. CY345]MCF2447679.1 ATP-binding protein [Dyadobacter sp. CY345]
MIITLESHELVVTKPRNCIAVSGMVYDVIKDKSSLQEQITEFCVSVFDLSNWPPRWSFGQSPDIHGWIYILSDLGICAAYLTIPFLLLRFVIKIKDTPFYKIILLFIVFITLCGFTHFMDAVIFWWPAYRLSAFIRLITAIISIITVYKLYKNLPLIQSLRTVRELEAEIKKRRFVEEQLAGSEFLLSEAERISRVGGWEQDLITNKFTWSKTALDIIELPAGASTENVKLIDYFDEVDKPLLAAVFEGGRVDGVKWDIELVLNTYTDKKIWVRISGEPLYIETGKVVKVRGILMDIDKYKTTEIALNKSLEITSKNNGQLKNFTHILSHNIRNHASNLQLISSLVNSEKLDTENAELFHMIKNVSQGLDATLEDLSQALKIKESIMVSELLDFRVVTDKTIGVLESDINVNHAEIICNFKVRKVRFPRIYLESILLNLIANAIKYRRPDVSPFIQLASYKNDDGYTVLECKDNGLGIDLNLHGQKIFGLYKTFHDHKDAHGVGLFLVKTQIESQGGRIELESTLGEGSTFKIIFNE